MSVNASQVFVLRHGETEWSLNGRHTGITDIPLTESGRKVAKLLQPVLAEIPFKIVLTSPLQRARETCALAGLGEQATVEPDLMEWNYGQYEGLTPQQIYEKVPTWMIFEDGCPCGEKPKEVGARVDRVIAKVRAAKGPVALFAHGHILRVFGARWLGLPPQAGAHFLLNTATLNVLSYYRGIPAIKCWNAKLSE
ncbi:MAG TPA: histidine phosphatase family protein [Nitrospiraceae bacterium]|nr:histidine phosphatase family protein [Nitrospiraceae bacterium]